MRTSRFTRFSPALFAISSLSRLPSLSYALPSSYPRRLAVLSLGASTGQPITTLQRAITMLSRDPAFDRIACSSCYRTLPVGGVAKNLFYNLTLAGVTTYSPLALLACVNRVERLLGRVRVIRHEDRAIDIDIIFLSDLVMNTPRLTIPHACYHERGFVLTPLCEIAPSLRDPVTRVPLTAYRARHTQGVWKTRF